MDAEIRPFRHDYYVDEYGRQRPIPLPDYGMSVKHSDGDAYPPVEQPHPKRLTPSDDHD